MKLPSITAPEITRFVKRMANNSGLQQAVFRVETITTKPTATASGFITSHISFDSGMMTEQEITVFVEGLEKKILFWREQTNDHQTAVIFKPHVF